MSTPRHHKSKKDQKKKKSSHKGKEEGKYAAHESDTPSAVRESVTPRSKKGRHGHHKKRREHKAKTTLRPNSHTHIYYYKVLGRGDNIFNQEEQEVCASCLLLPSL